MNQRPDGISDVLRLHVAARRSEQCITTGVPKHRNSEERPLRDSQGLCGGVWEGRMFMSPPGFNRQSLSLSSGGRAKLDLAARRWTHCPAALMVCGSDCAGGVRK